MRTLIIEPNSQADYQLFVRLAKRLHIKYREEPSKANAQAKDPSEEEFFALFGSLEGIDSEALIENITSSRTTKETDTSWIT